MYQKILRANFDSLWWSKGRKTGYKNKRKKFVDSTSAEDHKSIFQWRSPCRNVDASHLRHAISVYGESFLPNPPPPPTPGMN